MTARRSSAFAFVVFFGVLLAALCTRADEPISAAENLLFMTNHLAGLAPGTLLSYRYSKTGTLEPAREDEVRVRLSKPGAGSGPGVRVEYLTGADRFELPDVGAANGNPVILFFLERDVRQMQRRTGGQAAYFRKRVRLALAESAQLAPVQFEFGGRSMSGTQIVVQPYTNDPLRSRFEQLADKTYIFTVSDSIPGGVYRMQTTARPSSTGSAAPPLIEETVTLKQVQP
jgi:hypothetical protein